MPAWLTSSTRLELEELPALVERGPSRFAIDRIEIKLLDGESYPGITVEQSEEL
jgi:hypothetical protein